MLRVSNLAFLMAIAAACGLLTGCYTRLTTPKEAREYRTTYPELDQGEPIELQNARDNLGSTFIMTSEVYLDGVRRYSRGAGAGATGIFTESYRFREGAEIDIKLIGHPNNPIDGLRRVPKEGTIDIGPIKDFRVAGRTKRQVRADLQRQLARYYKGSPDPDSPPDVEVNIPSSSGRHYASADLGVVAVFSAASPSGIGEAVGNTSGSAGAQRSSGMIPLTGHNSLLHVLGSNGVYTSSVDWHEVVVIRKITTERVHAETGLPFEYTIMIVCDLEKILYEDPNQNIELRDGDIIYLHAEKSPLIVELFRTALLIADVYDAFNGVEFVIEDIFKRDF